MNSLNLELLKICDRRESSDPVRKESKYGHLPNTEVNTFGSGSQKFEITVEK